MTYALAGEHVSLSQIGARDPTSTPAVGSIIYVPAAGGGWEEFPISVPGTANFQNVLGATNGDTTVAWKQHYDDTNPANVSSSAAAPGTTVISARRDHVHLLNAAGVPTHDHGTAHSGLADDDHTQYALLAGRSGGQTLKGGTASGDDLTLQSTDHATKGSIFLGTGSAYDEVNDSLGLGTTTPGTGAKLVIVSPGVSVDRTSLIDVAGTQNNNGVDMYALLFRPTFAPDVNTSFAIGVFSQPETAPPTGITLSFLSAMYARIRTGSDAGAITQGRGLTIDSSYGSQKPGTVYGLNVENLGSASITDAVGIRIVAQSGASNNYDMEFTRNDTTAAGAYHGRIPVRYNGLLKYLHVFSA